MTAASEHRERCVSGLRLACIPEKPFSFGSHLLYSGSTPTNGVMAVA
jgi:hypothetical protein